MGSVVFISLAGCNTPGRGKEGEGAAPFPAVYVSDFTLDAGELASDQEPKAATGPVRRRLANLRRSPDDPASKAQEIKDLMSGDTIHNSSDC